MRESDILKFQDDEFDPSAPEDDGSEEEEEVEYDDVE